MWADVCCLDTELREATSQAGVEGKPLYMTLKWGSLKRQRFGVSLSKRFDGMSLNDAVYQRDVSLTLRMRMEILFNDAVSCLYL
jgi:hypothetical protein